MRAPLTDGSRSEVETFQGASLPGAWGDHTGSTGVVSTLSDANKTYVRDQADRWRMSEVNALGQLVKVTEDPTSSLTDFTRTGTDLLTEYTYDTLSNLTGVSQAYSVGGSSGTQTRTFAYSSLSRLLSAANPESGTIAYQCDPNGNLTQKTDGRSVVTTYAYDALNRPTGRSYSDGTPTVTYTYDSGSVPYGKGRLASVSNAVGSTTISTTAYTAYDPLGRVLSSTQTTDGLTQCSGTSATCLMSYKYNLAGALTDETYPSGRIVHHNYAPDGKLAAVSSRLAVNKPAKSYARNFSYNASGAVTDMQLGNMRWESTQFNSRMQPTQIALGTTQTGANARDLLQLNYAYDDGTNLDRNNGNVISQKITVRDVGATPGFVANQSYTYDELNRLKSATEMSTPNNSSTASQSWKQTYLYDRFGNRTFDTANNNTTTFPVNFNAAVYNPTISTANNQFDTDQGYLYDAVGNVTQDAEGRKFVYDGENKQSSFGVGGYDNNGGKYRYDGDGRRVRKEVAGEVTIFVYDTSGRTVAEYATTQSLSPQINYLTADALGSPRINTDASGTVIARHDYMPFGEEIFGTGNRGAGTSYGSDAVNNKFAGKERDHESGLDYFGARYYSMSVGRFTSVDPLAASANISDPQSYNRYTYANNNPLKYIDPTGLKKEPVFQAYEDIYDDQQRILENSSMTVGEGDNRQTLSGQALYDHLAKNDPKALANFLNQTTALMNFQVMMKDGDGHPAFTTGAALVNSVTSISQDRIIANVDPMLKDAVEIASLPTPGFKGLYSGPEDSGSEHGDFDVSFRQRMDDGPQQISFNSKNGFKSADIDIDYYFNRGAGGRLKHIFGEGLPNKLLRTKTDPYKVFEIMQKNPKIAIKPNYRIEDR